MASVSASHLIIFIASVLVAASVAGTLTTSVSDVSSAIRDQRLDTSREIRGDVEIISDPSSPVYDTDGNGNVSLLVKNTGTRELPARAETVDVVVDGRYRTERSVTPVDGDEWGEGDVVRLNVSAPGLGAGDHRVKVVVTGDSEVFTFRL